MEHANPIEIDLRLLYSDIAKLNELPIYIQKSLEQAGEGNDIILTGQAPVVSDNENGTKNNNGRTFIDSRLIILLIPRETEK